MNQLAEHFTASLPLGNGRLGAMLFGGANTEQIGLNESSVWSGAPQEADRPAAHQVLPEIRRLLGAGSNPEVEASLNAHFTCLGPGCNDGGGAVYPNLQRTNICTKLNFTGSQPLLQFALEHKSALFDFAKEASRQAQLPRVALPSTESRQGA